MATYAAASASYADVAAAIALASAGDSVTVPAGTSTWNNQLVITTGIILTGAGIGVTNITSNYSYWNGNVDGNGYLIFYYPSSPALNTPFELSGFSINAASKCNGVYVYNSLATSPLTKIRIHHNNLSGSVGSAMGFEGPVYGCVDNNVVTGGSALFQFFGPDTAWANFTYTPGTADTLYLEDNAITLTGAANSSASGSRWSWRHNAFTLTGNAFPVHDMHGNVGGRPSGMGAEIYENTYDCGGFYARIIDQRGAQFLVFNNTLTNSSSLSELQVREEYLDSLENPVTSSVGQPQHAWRSYYWNNLDGGVIVPLEISGTLYYDNYGRNVPLENTDCWNQKSPFDGTTGVGIGLLAARPATCTTGVGYWATDTEILYRAVATNTWEAYYTPYTYPHPLRGEGVAPDVMTVTSPNGSESWAGNSVHNITWTNTGETVYANVKIEYSANSGLTWTTITASTANTGSYSWTVPNTAGAAYMIKVTAVV
jgi:hypothetical protein